jgi:hypothetical protein
MSNRERDLHKIVDNYMKYLNGPLGKGVMDHLEEGESCTIESNDERLEITKVEGKAQVKILDYDTTRPLGDCFGKQ